MQRLQVKMRKVAYLFAKERIYTQGWQHGYNNWDVAIS